MLIPHTQPPIWPAIPSARFAGEIQRDDPEGCSVALIGLGDDLGVRLNRGRPGAAEGPTAFRAALARYGAAEPAFGRWPALFDVGDIQPADTLEETHQRITEAVVALARRGLLPIAVGGGHDLTWPLVRAVASVGGPLAGLYFDAHLDVRPEPGSGMAFRRLLESGCASSLELHGFNPLVNSAAHLDWFRSHGGRLGPSLASPQLPPGERLFVSFDLDLLDSSFAPGVSAPNPAGWSPREAEAWLLAAGRDPRVACFDLMELNPSCDPDGRTARIAAHLFLSFLRGFAERPA